MYSFQNDYSESMHPEILKVIMEEISNQNIGYGLDEHCQKAKEQIQKAMKNTSVDIHFLPGGTITNKTVIAHALRGYEAVISADTGHINVHETGAIEATGHKVIAVVSKDGKLTKEQIEKVQKEHTDEHMVLPKMVYISNPTELGTIYTKKELEELSNYCREQSLYLYLDGARLAMALARKESELTLEDLGKLTDAFYIGGTKVGAMFGEAVVLCNEELKKDFRFSIKRQGAMVAKGWLVGIEFATLFTNHLYEEIGRHANEMAELLRSAFGKVGIELYGDSPTNQVFVILPNIILEKIKKEYLLSEWMPMDKENTVVRFCTSFATPKEEIQKFANWLETLL